MIHNTFLIAAEPCPACEAGANGSAPQIAFADQVVKQIVIKHTYTCRPTPSNPMRTMNLLYAKRNERALGDYSIAKVEFQAN
jgi:hypothetical protein